MVDSPGQTTENLIKDIRFLQELEPDMIGIGPFVTHKETPFSGEPSGDLKKTLPACIYFAACISGCPDSGYHSPWYH